MIRRAGTAAVGDEYGETGQKLSRHAFHVRVERRVERASVPAAEIEANELAGRPCSRRSAVTPRIARGHDFPARGLDVERRPDFRMEARGVVFITLTPLRQVHVRDLLVGADAGAGARGGGR